MYTVEELIQILKDYNPKAKVKLIHDQCDINYNIESICTDEDPDKDLEDVLIVLSQKE